mmetsp:Transcript_6548/g.11880  ORF Transcript_6548/g.11880 Transcript_6548/m.11880 type:complete len:81 (+) Transcript_6548:401-643(+)|eukprot:CAMPEP_0201609724 /NCGR_PEP_ID=MMETSP0492-20130828/14548_1 /ASSEMBLY_ACC=CAM_ASM_000837 /TAXON_ID=420259 /ORGANISM="Thalassiosira gravida, Strain GMp14c1" /LENGTH=80 /DNA_ID=CAMNT_0048075291 /DNA_START=236 /DNA_END=478 /DNA_ORIENTATION=+
MTSVNEMNYEAYHETRGSWTLTILLATLFAVRRALRNSIEFQRFTKNQKIYWKNKLGYRDESKYVMGVGDGANMDLKRQG